MARLGPGPTFVRTRLLLAEDLAQELAERLLPATGFLHERLEEARQRQLVVESRLFPLFSHVGRHLGLKLHERIAHDIL